jgi:HEAT repeat protein
MTKRWLLRLGLTLLLGLGVVAIVPQWRWPILAWLQGHAHEQKFADRPSSYWAETLKGETDDAVQTLARGGRLAVPVLLEVLHDDDPQSRSGATRSLGRIVLHEPVVLLDLLAELKNGDSKIRAAVAEVVLLAAHDQGADPRMLAAVPCLIEAAKDPAAEVRVSAVRAIGCLAPSDREAIPVLIEALKDPDLGVRKNAVDALGKFGPIAGESLPPLLAALSDPERSVRRSAVRAVKFHGTEARTAVPIVVGLLEQPHGDVVYPGDPVLYAEEAAVVLQQIDPDLTASIPALVDVLRDEQGNVREIVLAVLAQLGPRAKPAVPALNQVLHDRTHPRPPQLYLALGAIGPDAREVIPALTEAIEDPDPATSASAAFALWRISGQTDRTLPALLRWFDADPYRAQDYLKQYLTKIGPAADDAVPALITRMQYKNMTRFIINILGEMGPSARAAVPALREASQDSDPYVSEAADKALQRIDMEGARAP